MPPRPSFAASLGGCLRNSDLACVLTALVAKDAEGSRWVHDGPTMEPPDALRAFRRSCYKCFHRRRDALFELTDAILTADSTAPSPAHLSLQASHRRGWGSLYAALDRGRIDYEALKPYASSWPAIRSLAPKGRRPSTPWTRVCGIAATRSAVPSADTTIILLATLPASRSWRAGPTSSSHNSTSSVRAGPLRWTCGASDLRRTPTKSLSSRSRLCWVGLKKGSSPCLSSTRATTLSRCSRDWRGARARSSSACERGGASTATRASRIRPHT